MATSAPARAHSSSAPSEGLELVRGYFAELDRSQGNAATLERYCTPDFVAHVPGAPSS